MPHRRLAAGKGDRFACWGFDWCLTLRGPPAGTWNGESDSHAMCCFMSRVMGSDGRDILVLHERLAYY